MDLTANGAWNRLETRCSARALLTGRLAGTGSVRPGLRCYGHHRNIRTSNANGAGLRKRTFWKWVGFRKIFHSPRIAAHKTSKAAVRSVRNRSSPNRRNDSSLVSCHPYGRAFASSLPSSTDSGISPSIETTSAGLRMRFKIYVGLLAINYTPFGLICNALGRSC
jgi:hypothetical protein